MKEIIGDKIKLSTPFNPSFIEELKTRISQRKWDSSEKVWWCNLSDEKTIDDLLYTHYGYVTGSNTKNIIIKAIDDHYGSTDSVYFAGKPLCRATGRDSGARVCNGITLLQGKIRSGGSVKNWTTVVEEGSEFSLEVPASFKLENEDGWEILSEEEKNREELLEEKQKLLDRIAKIDEELQKLGDK